MAIALEFGAVLAEWPALLKGAGTTLWLTACAVVAGGLLGIGCAWGRTDGPAPVRWLVGAYVEVIRNTPFIVQLFFIFFGLPSLGVKLSAPVASVLAMVINLGAYAAEIVRAGIQATPKGQFEAAASLAMTRWQTLRHVVLPPALQRVWPALVSQIIIVMLGSSVCGQISTEELTYMANLIQSRNFRAFEAFLIGAAMYLLMAMGVRWVLDRLGPRRASGGAR